MVLCQDVPASFVRIDNDKALEMTSVEFDEHGIGMSSTTRSRFLPLMGTGRTVRHFDDSKAVRADIVARRTVNASLPESSSSRF